MTQNTQSESTHPDLGQHTRALNLYPLALALSRKQEGKSTQQIEIERLYLSSGHYHNDGKTLYTSMEDLCANVSNLTYGGQIFVKLYKVFYLRHPDVIVSHKTGELRAILLPHSFMLDVQKCLKRLSAPLVENALDHPDLTPREQSGLIADKSVKALIEQPGTLYAPDAIALRTSLTMLFNWFEAADSIQSETLSLSVLRALSFFVDQTKASGTLADVYDADHSFKALFDSACAARRKLALMAQDSQAICIALQNIMIAMRLDMRAVHRFHAIGLMTTLNRNMLELPVEMTLFLKRMEDIQLKNGSFYQLDMELGDLHVAVNEDGTIPYNQAAQEYGSFLIRYVREAVILSKALS
mgnify:CR=1 FL=1